MIDKSEAEGELRAVYEVMASRRVPAAYQPPHGGTPGIQRTHSLDPKLLQLAFAVTASMHRGDSLSWAERELIAATASRTAQCLY